MLEGGDKSRKSFLQEIDVITHSVIKIDCMERIRIPDDVNFIKTKH